MMRPLPPDIVFFHILPRLPNKSVQWQSFLTTPMFANMHQHHHHKVLLIVLSTTTPCEFQTIDCESPGVSTVSHPLPFEVASHENVSIIASVRGLVCVRIINKSNEREYSDLVLWNPLTGEYKTLSAPNNQKRHVTHATVFGLYYSCNDYKLLLISSFREVYIYSLKSDSWRKVETNFKSWLASYWISGYWKHPCVMLNEKLYFLIRRIKCKSGIMFTYSIIRFDLKTEKLRKISTPSFGTGRYVVASCLSFTVVRGCIHLYVRYWNYDTNLDLTHHAFEVWRMDGDGDWTKMVTYNPNSWFFSVESILHFMRNGNWLVHDESGIYKIDVEKRTKEKICSSNALLSVQEGNTWRLWGSIYLRSIRSLWHVAQLTKRLDNFVQI